MLLHLYTQREFSNMATVVYAPLCDNVHRNGPRSLVLTVHKYSPGIFYIRSVLSLTYLSRTLSRSFDEYSQ